MRGCSCVAYGPGCSNKCRCRPPPRNDNQVCRLPPIQAGTRPCSLLRSNLPHAQPKSTSGAVHASSFPSFRPRSPRFRVLSPPCVYHFFVPTFPACYFHSATRVVAADNASCPRRKQLSDRMATFPTSLAGEVRRGLESGEFPGPISAASPRGTPDFIQFGEGAT